MSESITSDKNKYHWVIPFFILVAGLLLLWTGNRELQLYQDQIASYVSARPDNRTIWLLIVGAAASVAGAVGLLRERTV